MVSKRYDWYLVNIYLDFKSGEKQSDRSEFLRMMEDCKNRKIDIILTKSISRFGRNTEETIIAMRQLKEYGVKVIFDAENIDTISTDNELMITIITAFAQAENDERRKNQYWALKSV
jgi:DNA invertase Pin-like site-specific DNA recombinase